MQEHGADPGHTENVRYPLQAGLVKQLFTGGNGPKTASWRSSRVALVAHSEWQFGAEVFSYVAEVNV